ncbi:hypothetical protein [Streptomyces sp. BK208]|uniref:hypothetical protein n=1 Tax=Streptomyces sp. BK208 TaxID=2512150 RepID=UPI001061B652|nr:hypothetical protein [Streptomyces sp. BK208]
MKAVAVPPSVYPWHSRNAVVVDACGVALAGDAATTAPAPAIMTAVPKLTILLLIMDSPFGVNGLLRVSYSHLRVSEIAVTKKATSFQSPSLQDRFPGKFCRDFRLVLKRNM